MSPTNKQQQQLTRETVTDNINQITVCNENAKTKRALLNRVRVGSFGSVRTFGGFLDEKGIVEEKTEEWGGGCCGKTSCRKSVRGMRRGKEARFRGRALWIKECQNWVGLPLDPKKLLGWAISL